MAKAVDPLAIWNEPLLGADVTATRAWLRRGHTAIAGRHAVVLALGTIGLWVAVDVYKGVFGLLSSVGDFPGDAKPLLGLALFFIWGMGSLSAMFLLPRWEPPIATKGALRYLPHMRSAIFAIAILCGGWLGIKVPLVLLVPLIAAGVCTQCEIEAGGITPVTFLQRLLPQCAWAFLSIFWLVLWCEIWLHVAVPRMSQAAFDAAPLVMVVIVLSGCIVQNAMRLRDPQWPLAGLTCVATALCLANPGIPGLVGSALYSMGAGGGAFDIEASTVGRPVCDMGALGHHYYVLAGEEGCTLQRANRLLGRLRAMSDRERITFLLAERVQPASGGR